MSTTPTASTPRTTRFRWLIRGFLIGGLAVAGMMAGVGWFRSSRSATQSLQEGRSAMTRRDFAAAVDSFEQAVKVSPDLASAWKLLAEASYRRGDFERALTALESWSRIQPQDITPFAVKLGSQLMKQNRVDWAKRSLKCAADTGTKSPDPFRLLAQLNGVTGRPREVQACLVELLRRNAFTRDDLLVLGSMIPIISDPQHVQDILQVNPADPAPLLSSALDALNINQTRTATEYLTTIIEANPLDMEAQGILGELYADFAPEQFLDWHARLPNEANEDSRIWQARGKWLRRQGETRSAARCFHEAVEREPELLASTTALGQILNNLGEVRLGNAWTERAKLLQRIVDLLSRMREPHAARWMGPLIDELESVGRIWEAWGWSVIQTQSPAGTESDRKRRNRLAALLSFDLPRTKPGVLPGEEFDWEVFPLPSASLFQSAPASDQPPPTLSQADIRFEDQALNAGLDFRFVNSYTPETGRRIFETMGAGVGVLDYDQDGWPDLYFPQGKPLPLESDEGPSDALYRNAHGERFQPVTENAGIHETTYSQGVAVGDFDNDGFPDIYVANLGRNRLYRNNGDGTFSDATDTAGLQQNLWTVSCAIADLNGDGLPELFDVNYVQGKDFLFRTCIDERQRPVVCRPTVFDPAFDTVVINMGDGRFKEQQGDAGLNLPQGMGLGLVIADFNEDDRLDVFVANDQTANYLLLNESHDPTQPLRFRDEAHLRGLAFDLNGNAQACMGVACADINRDGVPDLYITNFARESNTLYLSQPGGYYTDATQLADLRAPSFDPLGFGTQFLDADRDGWFDLIVANGQIDEFVNEPYRMKAQVFRGQSDGKFTELSAQQAGPLFDELRLARGLALLDWNRDGRTDFVATDLERPILLGVNTTETSNHSLRLKLVGTQSSRDAIGAKVRVLVAPGDERVFQLTAGDGYESSNERVIEIAAGAHDRLSHVEITWPSGQISRFEDVSCEGDWLAIEGRAKWIARRIE